MPGFKGQHVLYAERPFPECQVLKDGTSFITNGYETGEKGL
jgi:hypothetical protein